MRAARVRCTGVIDQPCGIIVAPRLVAEDELGTGDVAGGGLCSAGAFAEGGLLAISMRGGTLAISIAQPRVSEGGGAARSGAPAVSTGRNALTRCGLRAENWISGLCAGALACPERFPAVSVLNTPVDRGDGVCGLVGKEVRQCANCLIRARNSGVKGLTRRFCSRESRKRGGTGFSPTGSLAGCVAPQDCLG